MKIEIGERFGKLIVIDRLAGSKLVCKCDCGNERIVFSGHLRKSVRSCGCHWRHGHSTTGNRSRTYICYYNMIARCYNEKNKRYKDYGGNGIMVCDRWKNSFRKFLKDMGECPENMTIDRIDNAKSYSPDNCRWATRSENQRNRATSRIWIVRGMEFRTMASAAKFCGVSSHTIRAWCLGRKAAGRYYYPKPDCNARFVYG